MNSCWRTWMTQKFQPTNILGFSRRYKFISQVSACLLPNRTVTQVKSRSFEWREGKIYNLHGLKISSPALPDFPPNDNFVGPKIVYSLFWNPSSCVLSTNFHSQIRPHFFDQHLQIRRRRTKRSRLCLRCSCYDKEFGRIL